MPIFGILSKWNHIALSEINLIQTCFTDTWADPVYSFLLAARGLTNSIGLPSTVPSLSLSNPSLLSTQHLSVK